MNPVFDAIEVIQRKRGTSDLRVGQIFMNALLLAEEFPGKNFNIFYMEDEDFKEYLLWAARQQYPLKDSGA